MLGASGVMLQDAPEPVSVEWEALLPCYLVSTHCVGGEPTEGHYKPTLLLLISSNAYSMSGLEPLIAWTRSVGRSGTACLKLRSLGRVGSESPAPPVWI